MNSSKQVMHLCFVVDTFRNLGGVQVLVQFCATRLDREQFKISIISMAGNEGLSVPIDVSVYLLNKSRHRYSLPALIKIFRSQKFDVVISSYEDMTVLAAAALFLAGAQASLIGWMHASPPEQLYHRFKNRIARALFRHVASAVFSRCAGFIAVAQGVKPSFEKLYRVMPERVRVVLNRIDSVAILQKRSEVVETNLQLESGSLGPVLFLGRLTNQKQPKEFLYAYASIRKEVAVKAWVIGDGELAGDLKKLAFDLGIANDVVFFGGVSNSIKYMQHASVMLQTSLWEGFPLTLLEAKFVGLPVVAYNCPTGPEEAIRDHEDGILVPLNNRAALVSSALVLLRDSSKRADFSAAALRNAGRFSSEDFLKNFADAVTYFKNTR